MVGRVGSGLQDHQFSLIARLCRAFLVADLWRTARGRKRQTGRERSSTAYISMLIHWHRMTVGQVGVAVLLLWKFEQHLPLYIRAAQSGRPIK
jgi:hypothetical protein